MAALMEGIRAAIADGRLADYSRAILDGASPYAEGAKSAT
jgi:hypothetical protein